MMLTQTARCVFSPNKEKIIKCVREGSRPCSLFFFFSPTLSFSLCGYRGAFWVITCVDWGLCCDFLKEDQDSETLSPHPTPLHPTLPHPTSLSAPGSVVCMSLKGRWRPVQAALPLPSKPFKAAPSKAHNVLRQRHVRMLGGGDNQLNARTPAPHS